MFLFILGAGVAVFLVWYVMLGILLEYF